MSELNIGKLFSECVGHIEAQGFSVGQSSDFEGLQAQMPGIGKSLVSPTMEVSRNDFSEANAFWLTLHSGDDLVGVMGMRADQTGREPVEKFWERAFCRHYNSPAGTSLRVRVPATISGMNGVVVYMGDLFFTKDIRGKRANLMAFVHLAHCLCFWKWQADWIYAFHRREDVLSGYADRYGFNNRWPGAQIWHEPPSYRSSEEYLSVLSRREFEDKATYYAENPGLLIRADPRETRKPEPRS